MQKRSNFLGSIDWPTVLLYLTLVTMGWLNIYAAVFSEEHSSIFDVTQRYGSQLLWILFAFGIALFVLLIDSRVYYVFANYIYVLLLLILVLVLLFGVEINASKSWFQMGRFRIQPAEFAKFATALALAKLMSSYNFKLQTFSSLASICLIVFVPAGLILLQNDTGSALVYAAFIFVLYREGLPHWVMLFLAFFIVLFILVLVLNKFIILVLLFACTMVLFSLIGRKYRDSFRFTLGVFGLGAILYATSEFFNLNISLYYLLLLPLAVGIPIALLYAYFNKVKLVLVLIFFLISTSLFSFSVDYLFHKVLERHHRERIMDLLGIETDPLGYGYNVNQSKIAIGSGGFFGKGYLQGTQTKFNFVPEQSTDFIFCTVGEEWGFMGSLVVVALFMAFILRILTLAERQKEAFARIYGYGVASIITFHALVNVGMTIGLFPVIGIPLPFFSYGGSSLWAFTMLLFIFLKFDSSRHH